MTYSLTTDDVRVLAFARGWSPDREDATKIETLRQRVQEVGIELIVLGDRGVWVFGVDGRLAVVDRLAGDLPLSATMYQARHGDAVFLVDEGSVVRLAYDGTLADAITGAGELAAMKRLANPEPQHSTMPNGLFAPVFESSYPADFWEGVS